MSDERLLLERDLCAMTSAIQNMGMDLRELGLDPAPAKEPKAMFLLVHEALARHSRDPTIMLSVGEAVPFGAYEIIDFLGASSDTVGQGLHEIARYFALITPTLRWSIDGEQEHPRIAMTSDHPFDMGHSAVQYSMGVTFTRFRNLADGDFRFVKVELSMPPPPSTKRHDEFFRCPIAYDADENAAYITRASWNATLQRSEPELLAVLQRHADDLLEKASAARDPLTPIRDAVATRLSDGTIKLEAVARELAMSARTLQRRLRELDTTFNAQVDHVRQSAARAYLADVRLTVGEVAYMLGYSDQSAFIRAFKRWTGETPREFRTT